MSQIQNPDKQRVAVFFGGRSPEHDVSVISGLQVLKAIDQSVYAPFPVYIDPQGVWRTGEGLSKRENFLLNAEALKQTEVVTLDLNEQGKGSLVPQKSGFLGKARPVAFDIALPVFHGSHGENGHIQGVFEMSDIPYTGMRSMASAILMDKAAAKKIFKALDIPTLPFVEIRKPHQGYFIPKDELQALLTGSIGFPCIIKPSHMGSSVGVAKADNIDELHACLPTVFECDTHAIIEPFVDNLVEYNVSVRRSGAETVTSAIERPKSQSELLDFKQKYMAGGDSKIGEKSGEIVSEGMLSLTRELNPDLDYDKEKNIRSWARTVFESLDGSGAPRMDFIGNAITGDIWMNEVNPCPGSYGYFLWEAAEKPLLFTEFLTALLEEAAALRINNQLPHDPVPKAARLLKRPKS